MHDMGNSSGVSVARDTVFVTSQWTRHQHAVRVQARSRRRWRGGAARDHRELPEAPGCPRPDGAIVSGPGAASYGYLTPAMVTSVGGPLTYTNGDIAKHDVISTQMSGGQPLFRTKLASHGRDRSREGLDNVESGKSYPFYCSLHTGMKGTLVVQ